MSNSRHHFAFSVVELLIVIVIVSILATISIIAYTSTTQRASVASLQSDLSNASKKIKLYYAEKGSYPTANNCPAPGPTEICLNNSGSNSFNYNFNNTQTPSFSLVGTNGDIQLQTSSTSNIESIPSIVTDGLIVYLDATKSSSYPGSGTVWYDLSGNGNDATLYSGVAYSASNGGALVFDKVNDYAQGNLNPNITVNSVFSTITWINASSVASGQHLTNIKGISQFYVLSGKLGTYAYGNVSGGTVYSNGWYMASMLRKVTGNSSLYLNDKEVAVGSLPSATLSTAYVIGNYVGGGSYYFGGKIAVSMIYNRALSQSEIIQNFNALRGRYGV